jgi:hypothetical protein
VAGVDAKTCPKDAEQEWRDACRCRKCSRPEDLLLAQAESEGRWRAVSVGAGAGRGAGAEAGAGRRAARDAAVALERTREIGAADEPALVAMRHSELLLNFGGVPIGEGDQNCIQVVYRRFEIVYK